INQFVFSWQKVLDLRNFEQDQAELELGKANAEVARIQTELDAVAAQRINVTNEIKGTTDIMMYAQAQQYFKFLDIKKDKFLEEMAQAQLVAEQKRDVVRQAMQKVKVLEKLKAKKLADWKKEELNQEELAMDDVVNAQFTAKHAEKKITDQQQR